MSYYKSILSLIIIAMVTVACAPKSDLVKRDPKALAIIHAQNLIEQGRYHSAANIFQQLANSSMTPERERFQLQSVLAYIDAEDTIAAKQIADTIDSKQLSGPARSKLFLFLGRIELEAGKAERALGYLNRVQPRLLSEAGKFSYHQNRADAFSMVGNLLESVKERVNVGNYLPDQKAVKENNFAIMEALKLLPEQTLLVMQAPPPDTLGGWMSLARIIKRYPLDSLELKRALEHWRTDFPDHPATESSIQAYIDQQFQEFGIPKSIAVLLPQSGSYTQSAKTIREGIVAAYYDNNAVFNPSIRFFDTQSGPVYSLYQQAVAQGADFVIGPLTKDNLLALIQGGDLPVPVLALNRMSQIVNHPNLVEFGLSPEDETEQAASSAWFDGYHRALVLAPSTNFGHRVASHFSQYWQILGGEILEVQTYDPKESDFSVPIKQLLNLNESEQRFNRLKSYVWDLQFNPRRRHDVDFIFLVARPKQARSIRPQLEFNHAIHVPVYATSHIFSGHHNPPVDRDLSKIVFCDIPWLIEDHQNDESSDSSLQQLRQQTPGNSLRLVALGFDAFSVIPYLNRLRRDSSARYTGLTGNLSIRKDNRIRRQLQCAQFVNGIPKSKGLAPHLQTAGQSEPSNMFSEETTIDVEY